MRWNYLSIPKLQRSHRLSLEIDKLFHAPLYWAYDYLPMRGLKLNHVSERDSRMLYSGMNKLQQNMFCACLLDIRTPGVYMHIIAAVLK